MQQPHLWRFLPAVHFSRVFVEINHARVKNFPLKPFTAMQKFLIVKTPAFMGKPALEHGLCSAHSFLCRSQPSLYPVFITPLIKPLV
jgi:hypothetical protein